MGEKILRLSDHYYSKTYLDSADGTNINRSNLAAVINEVTQTITTEQSSQNDSFSDLISQFEDIADGVEASINYDIEEAVNYMTTCMER